MDYTQMSNLMSAYYHEDFEGMWPTLDLFVRDATLDDLAELDTELQTFLAVTPVAEVARETHRLGSYLWLGEAPEPYVRWLEEMRQRVQQRLTHKSA